MLLSPGSPVLKVVKHVVIKSAPDLMWSSIKGADNFICRIVVRSCGRFLEGFVRLVVLYCNSYESVCQEVSGVNIWDAVVKEKVSQRGLTELVFYGIMTTYTRKIELFI